MDTSFCFNDVPVIGNLALEQAIVKLQEVGEDLAARDLEKTLLEKTLEERSTLTFTLEQRQRMWPFQDKPWQHTSHVFGYLAPSPSKEELWPIYPIDTLTAHPHLKQSRIKIALNRLRVASYPGGGTHCVLVHCNAENQIPGKVEQVHFQSIYRVREGEQAGVQGYPIFIGLKLGNEGLAFHCRTINVKNEQDEAFLGFLESDTFKSGLKLISTAQPALAPFSEMTLALAREVAKRHRNISIQDFKLGFDFGTNPMGARLAEGTYLAVQTPEDICQGWNWDEWAYRSANSQVVRRVDGTVIPYNYLAFAISRYEGS